MTQQQQPQIVQQPVVVQQVIAETTTMTPKVTSKISQLSNLEEQLSKIHQKPFTQQPTQLQQQQQLQQHPSSYSEAVRQSPTTVQQQFPQTTITQQQNVQLQPPVALSSIPSPVVTSQVSTPASAQKVSRFQVSKVEEQKATLVSQISIQQAVSPLKPLLSPEIEQQPTNVNFQQQQPQQQQQMTQQMFTNTPQTLQMQALPQSSQAQAFFQQHQGGVVSKRFPIPLFLFLSYFA